MTERRRFIQVIVGTRHVGKSTMVSQLMDDLSMPHLSFSADDADKTVAQWISQCWSAVRAIMHVKKYDQCILIIDEIQKISNWSETVKKEWDHDSGDAGLNPRLEPTCCQYDYDIFYW